MPEDRREANHALVYPRVHGVTNMLGRLIFSSGPARLHAVGLN